MGCQTQSPMYEWLGQLHPAPSDHHNNPNTPGIVTESGAAQTEDIPATPPPKATTAFHPAVLPDGLYSCLERLIDAADIACPIGEIPRRVYAGCVLVGNRVYLVGGFDGTNALKSTLCYDFEVDSGWCVSYILIKKIYIYF